MIILRPATGARQLTLLAVVQVCAMSVWFSASAVLPALRAEGGLRGEQTILPAAAVQLGFACGAVASAQLLPLLAGAVGRRAAVPVPAIGPLLGAAAMHRLRR